MRKISTILVFFLLKTLVLPAQNAISTHLPFGSNFETAARNTTFSEIINRAKNQFFPLAERWENTKNKHQKNTAAEFLFVVTTDGLRWQEVFEGADSSILAEIETDRAKYFEKYFAPKTADRRRKLMPFLWSIFEKNGQIFGNQNFENQVVVSNRRHISYPGYSEIFCGLADDSRILLNTKKSNPNVNVLEWFSKQRGYRNRVAAFGSWELFPFILNEKRAKIEVNGGFEKLAPKFGRCLSPEQNKLNNSLETCPRPWKNHLRPDTLTWAFAQNFCENRHPKVVFLGFGETDEYAHEGNYGGYLDAAARFDSLLTEVWFFIQNDEKYRGKTAILVTTDHGRGRKNWQSHHVLNPGSDEIWMAVASPDLEKRGEIRTPGTIFQKQFAQTMANLIGFDFEQKNQPIAERAEPVFEKTIAQPEPIFAEKTDLPDLQTSLKK